MSNIVKRRKNYGNYWNKKQKYNSLNIGMKGFLCTCNTREKDCELECYNILNKYADRIFGSDQLGLKNDVEDSLEDEVGILKADDNVSPDRRFHAIASGVKNVLFISTTLDDPVKLGEGIMRDIIVLKQPQTKFLLRLVPIEVTCKACVNDIKQAIEPLLGKYFTNSPKTFAVVFSHRNNNTFPRDDIIKMVADMISNIRTDHTVNLKNADICVIIEIIRGFAMLSVIPDYFKYKRYNLHAFGESDQNKLNTEQKNADK